MPPTEESPIPRRKRRTREHIIEDLSENHLERKVLLRGHLLRRPERDYGVDVTMFHFDENGEIENGEIRFQLKATERLRVIKNGTTVSFSVKTADLHYWSLELYPFILVVFDAENHEAYWLHIQPYVGERPEILDSERETVSVHIPITNALTLRSIDCFRLRSLEFVEQFRQQGGFRDAPR